MSEYILPGQPPVRVTLRRSAGARRYSLRVSRLDGRVTLTIPRHAPETKALAFAREKAGWIRQRLAERPEDVAVDVGVQLPVDGMLLTVARGPRSQVARAERQLVVSTRADSVPAAVAGLLKARARDRLAEASDYYSRKLGKPYVRMTLRDTRSRWGSCSTEGALMYSWRLILAPPEVLQYVAAHEVAHLAEMNHGPAFWATVERLRPGYETQRQWLRQNGEDLHRYRFSD
ncbi:M48 family metallopeptidase [Tropicimonas marinistellae]|uniref:M48 family metallopeptidase n=1 Tax=Tropicimonas marinistellae TaxID=1739787 RepID=UPI000836E104|nr:SprT family zinc-dependent metalloprotease [Tropicimonas marinistellae]